MRFSMLVVLLLVMGFGAASASFADESGLQGEEPAAAARPLLNYSDPLFDNLPGEPAGSPTEVIRTKYTLEDDKRLEAAVRLEGVQMRLFQITDQISRQTGIDVRAGSNNRDWMVRDLPVTLYVNDLKASVVLQSLADLLHLRLSPERVKDREGKDAVAWRLWRDSKTRQAMQSFEEDRKAAGLQKISSDLDKLLEAANLSDNAWGKKPEHDDLYRPSEQSLKDVLTGVRGLTPEQKEGLRAGTPVTLGAGDLPPGLMDRLYRDLLGKQINFFMNRMSSAQDTEGFLTQPRESDLENAKLSLSPIPESGSLQIYVTPIHIRENHTFSWGANIDGLLGYAAAYTGGRSPSPEQWTPPKFEVDGKNSEETQSAEQAEASQEFLQEEIEYPPLPSAAELQNLESSYCPGSYVIDVAKAHSINVIIQDHQSQMNQNRFTAAPPGNPRARYMLLTGGFSPGRMYPEHRLMTNTIPEWIKQQNQLIPYGVLQMLEQKASTNGVEFDDLVPLTFLNKDGLRNWIYHDYRFNYMPYQFFWEMPLFKLYAQLTPHERALARSDSGLPLGSVGLKRLEEIAAVIKATTGSVNSAGPDSKSSGQIDAELGVLTAATDAQHLMEVSLFVTHSDDPSPYIIQPTILGPGSVDKTQLLELPRKKKYQLELRWPDGRLSAPPETIHQGMPLFSSKRLKELKSQREMLPEAGARQ